jgi:hypothetical protein
MKRLIGYMKSIRFIFALQVLAIAGSLHASTFSFGTPTGAKDLANNPVSVESIFVVSGNQLQITLENNSTNPIDDGQILSALTFQLTNQVIPTGATISFSGTITEEINVNSNGTFTPVSTCNGGSNQSNCTVAEDNWTGTSTITGPANNSTIQFAFCDANIVAAGCPSKSSQTYGALGGIIGGPNGSNRYTSTGITQNAKNPYIFEKATLDITLSAGTFNVAQSNYTNLIFGLGTTSTDEDAIHGEAPEPASFWMMAAGLALGIAAFKYKRQIGKSA